MPQEPAPRVVNTSHLFDPTLSDTLLPYLQEAAGAYGKAGSALADWWSKARAAPLQFPPPVTSAAPSDTGGAPVTLPGATPPTPAGTTINSYDPTFGRGGIGSDARFPLAATPSGQGGIGSDARFPPATTPSGQGGIGSDARFPPATTPSGQGGIGSDARFPLRNNPDAPAAAAQPASATRPAPNLGYYSPFATIDRPNAPAGGSARGGGGPINPFGALDLSRLFRPGQPTVSGPLAAQPPQSMTTGQMVPTQGGLTPPTGPLYPYSDVKPYLNPRYAGSGAAAFPIG